MRLLAIMETDVRAIRIKPTQEDLLLCDHREQEAGKGLGGGGREQELCTPSSLREFLASSERHAHWA